MKFADTKPTKWTYYSPTFEFTKDLPLESSAWSGHYFFAYDLVSNIKPKTIVELGTHKGNSLFSFAQAIKDNKLQTSLHAVDTWEGDKHAGHYTENIYRTFLKVKNKYYKEVKIVPHRMYFDQAVLEFKDDSIDILHIDGLHTYEAVKKDFETWLPKVKKDSGVILLHDICEKKEDFGVHKLWSELQKIYNTVTFENYHGLGVVFINPSFYNNYQSDITAWLKLYPELSEKEDLAYSLKLELKRNGELHQRYLENLKNTEYLLQERDETITEMDNMTSILKEYNGFKDGKIWRLLKVWRKIKLYIGIRMTSIIKIVNRLFSYVINSPRLLVEYGLKEFLLRTYISLRYINYSESNRHYQLTLWKSKPTKLDFRKAQEIISDFEHKPLLSIVMPVYNVEPKWLRVAITSIRKQWYENWELCIADDCSTDTRIKPILEEFADLDTRIKVTFRSQNGHISECTNSALDLSLGEYIVLMDNDDEIYPQALYKVAKAINENPEVGLIYSDEDKIEMNGVRTDPILKPSYDSDYLLSTNYFCHLTVVRKDIIDKVGGFRKGYEGSQDYDLFLRAVEQTNTILHVKDILYGWRKIPGSTALKYDEKGYAQLTSLKALEDTITRRSIKGEVVPGLQAGFFRVKYQLTEYPPVTIIVKANKKEAEKIKDNLLSSSTYPSVEVIVTSDYSSSVKESSNNFVILAHKDIEIKNKDWIENLLEHAQRENIVAVSGKIYSEDNSIYCTGFNLNKMQEIENTHPTLSPNMQNRANLIMSYDTLPLICVMTTKEKFKKLQILESEVYPHSFVKGLSSSDILLYTPYTEVLFKSNLY